MFLMYVDESGDTGLSGSMSRYFCLSGLVVHELQWQNFVNDLLNVRKNITAKYGISFREEIHCAQFLRHAHSTGLPKNIRLQVLRDLTRSRASLPYRSVTNIVVDKLNKPSGYDVFDNAWKVLFQRFENTLRYRNFPGPANTQDYGLVFCDDTNGKKLQSLVRKMSVYNPIPNSGSLGYRQLPLRLLVEDPSMRNSKDSLPIQAADLCAYMLYQNVSPCSYVRKKSGHGYLNQLQPVLNLHASRTNQLGIVNL